MNHHTTSTPHAVVAAVVLFAAGLSTLAPAVATARPGPPAGSGTSAPQWHGSAAPLHDLAVQSFRRGRFPEAYGRFIALADAGHPPSARYALWMCENGMALFGHAWDCAPHQVQDWAAIAAVPVPVMAPLVQVRTLPAAPAPRR